MNSRFLSPSLPFSRLLFPSLAYSSHLSLTLPISRLLSLSLAYCRLLSLIKCEIDLVIFMKFNFQRYAYTWPATNTGDNPLHIPTEMQDFAQNHYFQCIRTTVGKVKRKYMSSEFQKTANNAIRNGRCRSRRSLVKFYKVIIEFLYFNK